MRGTTRRSSTLDVLATLLVVATAASAAAQVRTGPLTSLAPCSHCIGQAPILDITRPALPDELGYGVQACQVVRSATAWNDFCATNAVPGCPALDAAFFAEHSVVAVTIDTPTPRVCEGTAEPLWSLDCVTLGPRWVGVRVGLTLAGRDCTCTAPPQTPQRLFLAAAVDPAATGFCRACEEEHITDCY